MNIKNQNKPNIFAWTLFNFSLTKNVVKIFQKVFGNILTSIIMFSWWGGSERTDEESEEGEKNNENSCEGNSGEKVEQKDATETAKDLAMNFGSKFCYLIRVIIYSGS